MSHADHALSDDVLGQLDFRIHSISDFLTSIDQLDAIAARGGPLAPSPAGVYKINDAMLDSYRSAKYANHASNLGALIANHLQRKWNVPSFIVDPVTTDDMIDVARISGVPGIERKSRSHALNIRYCARKAAIDIGKELKNTRFIVAHLGTGFSIASVLGGNIVDVNDALLGMGPFSVERAGALPLSGMLNLMGSTDKSKNSVELQLSKESGLKGYLGTNDIREVEENIRQGDKQANLIYRAMIYQIAKEIGAIYAIQKGETDGLILTGGVVFSDRMIQQLTDYLPFIERRFIYPGSFELDALAEATLRVLNKEELWKEYQPC